MVTAVFLFSGGSSVNKPNRDEQGTLQNPPGTLSPLTFSKGGGAPSPVPRAEWLPVTRQPQAELSLLDCVAAYTSFKRKISLSLVDMLNCAGDESLCACVEEEKPKNLSWPTFDRK